MSQDSSDLDMFFKPKSVAIIGVSRETRKFGHVIFQNFLESNINAKIFPINPQVDKIMGYKCYKSIIDVPDEVDLVVNALSRKFAIQIMKECAQKGVRGVIIIAGGFSETGQEGKNIESEVLKIAKENNIRIIGPNVIGIYDPYSGVDTLFLPRYRVLRPRRGKIGFISQSGAFGSALLDFAASNGVGISKFCSIGNAIDVDAIDLLEYLERDPNTNCIMLYMEGIKTKDAKEFQQVIQRISVKKPLVLLKGGITEQGQKAAASHTGSIASQIEVLQALFRQAGVIVAEDALQLFDMGRILSTSYLPDGGGIAIITNAGGFGVLTTDYLIKKGYHLASLKNETIKDLQEKMPPEVIISNPTDLVGNADTERYKIALHKILEDPNVHIVILIILLSVSYVESDIIDVINDARLTYRKPILVTTIGGDFTQMMVRMMEENNVPTFPDPKRTVDAVKALLDYSKHCTYHECELDF
ncbi:MAG: CoA-binding protein [Candidatus Lokiarchaeota archaeon]|nr:CoA-binding protein [Candidatus Lokiarchaeota archaeon]